MKYLIQFLAASFAALILQMTVSIESVTASAAPLADVPAVIMNPSIKDAKLSKKEIKDIFLGKTTTWKDGSPIVIFNLDDKDVHGAFTKQYTSKTESQYKNYWKKIVFTGKGKMPKSQRNEKKMISAVSKTAGSMGYVSAATSTDASKMKGKDGKPLAIVVTVK